MPIIGVIASSIYKLKTIFSRSSAATPIAYQWINGFGSKYSDPATLPSGGSDTTGSGKSIEVTPDGTGVVMTQQSTPFIHGYAWSSSGWGSKVSDPATLPGGATTGVVFNSTGTVVISGISVSPRIIAYPWSSSGFGTKYANPGTLPGSTGYRPVFNSNDTEIVMGIDSAPRIYAISWSGGFGTKRSDPAVLPPNSSYSTAFNNNGSVIATANFATLYAGLNEPVAVTSGTASPTDFLNTGSLIPA